MYFIFHVSKANLKRQKATEMHADFNQAITLKCGMKAGEQCAAMS